MQTSHIIQHVTLTFDIHLCQMFANLKFFNLTVSTFKRTTLINRVWLIQQLIHLQPLQVHCIIKVTLYLGIQWMYNSLQCIQNRKKTVTFNFLPGHFTHWLRLPHNLRKFSVFCSLSGGGGFPSLLDTHGSTSPKVALSWNMCISCKRQSWSTECFHSI